jgi:hypothetical protein
VVAGVELGVGGVVAAVDEVVGAGGGFGAGLEVLELLAAGVAVVRVVGGDEAGEAGVEVVVEVGDRLAVGGGVGVLVRGLIAGEEAAGLAAVGLIGGAVLPLDVPGGAVAGLVAAGAFDGEDHAGGGDGVIVAELADALDLDVDAAVLLAEAGLDDAAGFILLHRGDGERAEALERDLRVGADLEQHLRVRGGLELGEERDG